MSESDLKVFLKDAKPVSYNATRADREILSISGEVLGREPTKSEYRVAIHKCDGHVSECRVFVGTKLGVVEPWGIVQSCIPNDDGTYSVQASGTAGIGCPFCSAKDAEIARLAAELKKTSLAGTCYLCGKSHVGMTCDGETPKFLG